MITREKLLEKVVDNLYEEYLKHTDKPKSKDQLILEASVQLKKELPILLTKRSKIIG